MIGIGCGARKHVWSHTDGKFVFDPIHADRCIDENQRCLCGTYWYSQRHVLLATGFTVGSIPAEAPPTLKIGDVAKHDNCSFKVTGVVSGGDSAAFDSPIYPTTPMCPRCGLVVPFLRRSEFVGDLVPVACQCGWRGKAPVAR